MVPSMTAVSATESTALESGAQLEVGRGVLFEFLEPGDLAARLA